MTLVEIYHHDRKLEWAAAQAALAGDRLEVRAPSVNHALWLSALGCLWAGAFAIKFGWIVA